MPEGRGVFEHGQGASKSTATKLLLRLIEMFLRQESILQTRPSTEEAKKILGAPEVEVFEYYRFARNRFMHVTPRNRSIELAYPKLGDHASYLLTTYKVVPSHFDHLTFDDFILFSRVIKKLGISLCAVAKPDQKHPTG